MIDLGVELDLKVEIGMTEERPASLTCVGAPSKAEGIFELMTLGPVSVRTTPRRVLLDSSVHCSAPHEVSRRESRKRTTQARKRTGLNELSRGDLDLCDRTQGNGSAQEPSQQSQQKKTGGLT